MISEKKSRIDCNTGVIHVIEIFIDGHKLAVTPVAPASAYLSI